MDWKLELVAIPVSDVDRAKAFYVDQVGFHADHDHRVDDQMRFVQLTPPGSACSKYRSTRPIRWRASRSSHGVFRMRSSAPAPSARPTKCAPCTPPEAASSCRPTSIETSSRPRRGSASLPCQAC